MRKRHWLWLGRMKLERLDYCKIEERYDMNILYNLIEIIKEMKNQLKNL